MRIVSYLESKFDVVVCKNGAEYGFCCPMCEERIGRPDTKYHFSFHVGKQLGNCFKCGWKPFSAIQLVADVEHVSIGDAYNILQKYPSVAVYIPVESDVVSTIKLPKGFHPFYPRDMCKSVVSKMAWDYVIRRGLSKQLIREYGIGHCGIGEWAQRIIIPLREAGQVVYFVGRSFRGGKPRYKYPIVSDAGGIGKSDVVAFLDTAAKRKDLVICEGVFDAMAVGRNAVAILGKSLSDVQLHKILLCGFKTVTIMLDHDAEKEAFEIARRLSGYVQTNVALLDSGDPADNRGRLSDCRVVEYSLESEIEEIIA